jgi:Flp pilus assembly protein TadD
VNACIGYGSYLRKAFFPTELGVFYPGRTPSAAIAALAFVILLGATLAVFAFARRHPSCPVGWFWFLGMLVPVSGIVQVGTQSTADRYMYLPLVGLSIAVIWPVAELLTPHRFIRRAAAVIACTVLVLLGVQAFRQVTYWKSSRTLFEHTLAVTADNYIMHNNLGVILAQEGKFAEAVAHYRQAVAINPNYEDAHGNLGHELLRAGDLEGAYTHLARSVEIWPNNARFQADLADVLVRQGKFPEAQRPLEEAIRLAPEKSEYHSNLGYVLQKLGRTDEAIARYAEAIRLKPDSADAHYNMGLALAAQGKTSEAAAEMSKAAALNPDYANPGLLLEQLQTRR